MGQSIHTPIRFSFFFEHVIYLNNSSQPLTHSLALVKWYKSVQNHRIRFHCQVDNDIKSCNIELWTNEFYDMSRDSIVPIHNLLGKFVKCNFNIGIRKVRDYMAIISLNKNLKLKTNELFIILNIIRTIRVLMPSPNVINFIN
jgi:hypothetical protein